MSENSSPPKLALDPQASDEAKMRQALGLRDGGSPDNRGAQRTQPERRARRFVRDGEIPVVVLNTPRDPVTDAAPPGNRVAAAEAALASERTARERAERALADAVNTIQHLQTKLGHADIAHQEAIEAERAGRDQAEATLREAVAARADFEARLADERTRREAAEAELQEAVAARDDFEHRLAVSLASRAQPGPGAGGVATVLDGKPAPAAGTRIGRLRRKAEAPEEGEPEPVKWWLPSYRAGLRKR